MFGVPLLPSFLPQELSSIGFFCRCLLKVSLYVYIGLF